MTDILSGETVLIDFHSYPNNLISAYTKWSYDLGICTEEDRSLHSSCIWFVFCKSLRLFAQWRVDKTPMSNIKYESTFKEEVLSRLPHAGDSVAAQG